MSDLKTWAAGLLIPAREPMRCPKCQGALEAQRSGLATWSAHHPLPSDCPLTYGTWGYYPDEDSLRAAFARGEGLRKAAPERIALVQEHIGRLLLIVGRKKREEG